VLSISHPAMYVVALRDIGHGKVLFVLLFHQQTESVCKEVWMRVEVDFAHKAQMNGSEYVR
jgi:hypothetical protein